MFQYRHIAAPTNEAFIQAASTFLKDRLIENISKHGGSLLGLSGGSTPRPIYTRLASEQGIDWSKVKVFLIDERYIAPDHKDSNTKLVTDTLLTNKSIPHDNFLAPNTTLPLADCIKDFEARLGAWVSGPNAWPMVAVLGLGDDGHFASLFPANPQDIEKADQGALVLHTTTEQFAVRDRITTTYKVVVPAQDHVFFMTGENKLKVWQDMVYSAANPARWPAHKVLATGHTTLVSSKL
jgi:6-phosphogluconolactonase